MLTDDPKVVLPDGAQIVQTVKPQPPMDMIGHVTSSYWSPALNRSIALALVRSGRARMGETVHVPLAGKTHAAKVAETVFYDPEGVRLHG